MSNRLRTAELQRQYREKIIADGKAKFIRREVGFSFVFFVGLMTILYFTDGRTQSVLVVSAIVVAIGMFSGYLHAVWRWKEMAKQP
jgi:hypothetical protein